SNGTRYTVVVLARNVAGDGRTASVHVTPRTLPGEPAGVAATGGIRSLSVRWSAPSSTGGTPISGYLVTASDGTSTHSKTVGGTSTSTTLTRLLDGTTYSVRVVAI